MKIVILDAKTLGDDLDFSMFNKFGKVEIYDMTDDLQVKYRIKDADVIIVNKIQLNRENLKFAEKLKLICVTATGYDNIDLNYCWQREIGVCNVKGYSTESVAQVALSMGLSLISHIPSYDKYVKDYKYTMSGVQNYLKPSFHELSSLVWGVVGLGNIGKRTADMAKALGMKVIAYSRTPNPLYEMVKLDRLCSEADIISVHMPLTEETRNLIDEDYISMMKKSAVFINVSRGSIADENALADAVIDERIGGLGIDVYSVEPIQPGSPYNKIFDFENVIFTPHMAWAAYESRIRCMEEIVKNIETFFRGGIRNRVDL